jgi:hypothetical protein
MGICEWLLWGEAVHVFLYISEAFLKFIKRVFGGPFLIAKAVCGFGRPILFGPIYGVRETVFIASE